MESEVQRALVGTTWNAAKVVQHLFLVTQTKFLSAERQVRFPNPATKPARSASDHEVVSRIEKTRLLSA